MNARIFKVVMTVLAAGMSMVARADDSSLSPFGGDSFAYFQQDGPRVTTAPSTLHPDNLKDTSEREYQALSSWAPVWHPAPAPDKTPATFRMTNPTGLSVREYQALSTWAPAWHTAPLVPVHQTTSSAERTQRGL